MTFMESIYSIKVSQTTMKELKKLAIYMNLENKETGKGKPETMYDLAIFNALGLPISSMRIVSCGIFS